MKINVTKKQKSSNIFKYVRLDKNGNEVCFAISFMIPIIVTLGLMTILEFLDDHFPINGQLYIYLNIFSVIISLILGRILYHKYPLDFSYMFYLIQGTSSTVDWNHVESPIKVDADFTAKPFKQKRKLIKQLAEQAYQGRS